MTGAQHGRDNTQQTHQPRSVVSYTPSNSDFGISFHHRVPSIEQHFATAERRTTIEPTAVLGQAKHPRLSPYRTLQVYKWLGGVDVSGRPECDDIREDEPEEDKPGGNETIEDEPKEAVPAERAPANKANDLRPGNETPGCGPWKGHQVPLSYDTLHKSANPYRPPHLRNQLE